MYPSLKLTYIAELPCYQARRHQTVRYRCSIQIGHSKVQPRRCCRQQRRWVILVFSSTLTTKLIPWYRRLRSGRMLRRAHRTANPYSNGCQLFRPHRSNQESYGSDAWREQAKRRTNPTSYFHRRTDWSPILLYLLCFEMGRRRVHWGNCSRSQVRVED